MYIAMDYNPCEHNANLDQFKRGLWLWILTPSNESNYVLKVAGQNSYLHGAYELMEFAYVIRCLMKKTDIDLALVERVDPSIDRLRDIEDVSGHYGI